MSNVKFFQCDCEKGEECVCALAWHAALMPEPYLKLYEGTLYTIQHCVFTL